MKKNNKKIFNFLSLLLFASVGGVAGFAIAGPIGICFGGLLGLVTKKIM